MRKGEGLPIAPCGCFAILIVGAGFAALLWGMWLLIEWLIGRLMG